MIKAELYRILAPWNYEAQMEVMLDRCHVKTPNVSIIANINKKNGHYPVNDIDFKIDGCFSSIIVFMLTGNVPFGLPIINTHI